MNGKVDPITKDRISSHLIPNLALKESILLMFYSKAKIYRLQRLNFTFRCLIKKTPV